MSEKFYPPFHYFLCPECDVDKEIQPKDFSTHLKNVHNIIETKGQRSLMLHINKKPRHCSSYKWEIGGKEFYEYYG